MYELEKCRLSVDEMVARIEEGLRPEPGVVLIYAPHTESAEQSTARWKANHAGEALEGKRVVILRYAVEERA